MSQIGSATAQPNVEEADYTAASTAERQPWELYTLVAGLIAQSALVLIGNQPNVSTWLLALLAIGVGQALLLPATAGWVGGCAVVVGWVVFRQAVMIWSTATLVQSLVEVAAMSLILTLAVRYRQIWHRQQQELQELRILWHMLVAGEVGTGLLPRAVAELRLREEVDRARQFRRPLGLLLVDIEPLAQDATEGVEAGDIFQAVARQLVSASFVHDIPFRASARRLGIILLERTGNRLYEDAEVIVSALRGATLIDRTGSPQPLQHYAALHFGLATYQGVEGSVDLMRAAADSLTAGPDLADPGESGFTACAVQAAPIDLSAPLVSDEEE